MAKADSIEYRDVPGFPGYRAGSDGTIWSRWRSCIKGRILTDNWRLMKQSVKKNRSIGRAYHYLNLTADGKATTFRVHRLILLAFVGPCPEGLEARHLDGIAANNHLTNLAWGTVAENTEDRKKHARYTNRNRLYTRNGRTLVLKDWAREAGIPYLCLWHRVNKLGMSFEQAITRPYLGTSSNGAHWTAAKRHSVAQHE